jgi:hypothetical protein
MVTAMYTETLNQLHMTWHNPKSQSYTLDTGHKNPEDEKIYITKVKKARVN